MMAFRVSSSAHEYIILSLKLALASTFVLSVAVLLKLCVPSLTYFAFTELPLIYSSVLSWLRPPYLYLVINGIIISIVASSKLQTSKADEPIKQPEINLPSSTVVVVAKSTVGVLPDYIDDDNVDAADGSIYQAGVGRKIVERDMKVMNSDGDAVVSSESVQPPAQGSNSMELLLDKLEKEKPLVSARFGHKKSVKSFPDGGKATLLGVSKSRRNDTLENTWKMITDGRAMPLTRHLKKSDTWDTHLRRDGTNSPQPDPKMNKSDTFTENNSKMISGGNRQGSAGKLKKEPSLTQDELNRRVEAFIHKFNEEMRLQREESLNRCRQMVAY